MNFPIEYKVVTSSDISFQLLRWCILAGWIYTQLILKVWFFVSLPVDVPVMFVSYAFFQINPLKFLNTPVDLCPFVTKPLVYETKRYKKQFFYLRFSLWRWLLWLVSMFWVQCHVWRRNADIYKNLCTIERSGLQWTKREDRTMQWTRLP